jgi:thiopurine S-methyltransferase
MEAKFWRERWERNEIGFHEPKPNPLLVKYFGRLKLRKGARVFVPLCGKTLDIGWFLSKGYRVAGAELSAIAIEQLFAGLKLKPTIMKVKGASLVRYSARGIDIFAGDIFKLNRERLGRVDAIYDRAALVALPEETRKRYTAHLTRITRKAPQLLISFEYDQSLRAGPPFSISNVEMVRHYAKIYDLRLLASAPLRGGLKGNVSATENVWLLRSESRSAAR